MLDLTLYNDSLGINWPSGGGHHELNHIVIVERNSALVPLQVFYPKVIIEIVAML